MRLDRVIAVRNSKIVYRDSDACVKVFNDDYSKADVISEALNQARMEETGLGVPKVREITTVDGKWAIVSDYIKGKSLEQLMIEDCENKDKYIEMLVDLQLEVHSKESHLLGNLKNKMRRKISHSDLDFATRSDFQKRLEDMPEQNKVCHGDFRPSNIIIRDDGKAFIIDWAHAAQGNVSADAAETYLIFLLQGDTESAGKYLELFCDKSGTAKEYVEKWMPLVAASRSVKGNEKEREYLLSLINIVDYE